ncbi:LytR family transcriptional regulator [Gordonia amarae]|uniref:LytR family transcriptional regulator n=2 Tax=Gordonia amarae TaxID=36821 RepID=A0A857LV32_9ACTN|nr:LCP family protein [Gordonia amarae]QHN19719.1 LytR family transcriptional regulator [Gordonia amarae]QHN24183.1 LytR family transcriptional regulator [Gordonia amarae]QHN33101.1 LytR family transcriptional regulator [Gordonia amarae]QHN41823.1 LytR family transcriptional regulator [Gordonia amarae]GAB06947.1 putative LytR family regulatory protein [Gordonia amarae NBRC 15530]
MTVRELLEQMNAEGEAFDDAGQPEPDESPTMAHRFGSLFRGDRDQNQRDAEARDRREQRPRPPIRDVPPPRPGGRPGRHTSPPPPGGTPQGRNRPPVAPPGLDVTQRIPTIGDRDADVDLSEQATRRRAIAESRGQEPAPSDAPFDVIPPVAPARSGQDDTPTELIPVVGDDTAPETPVPPAADKTAEPADTEPVSVAALTADDETAAETPATEPEQPARSLIKGRARPLQRTPDLAAARTRVAAARGKAARRKALVRDATITGRILVAVACVLSLVGTGFVWGYIQSVNGNWRSIEALDSGDDNIRNKDAQHGDENYLIVGTDTRGGKNSTLGAGSADDVEGARSDTVILVSVPSDRDRVVAVSFPRDLQVDRPDCSSWDNDNGTYDAANVLPAAEAVKLNSVYAEGGPKCLVQVLTAMSGLNINHFIAMDFDGFEKVVRAIGGVEVCSTVPLYDYELGWILRKKGPKKLNGRYALNYVRARKIETEGNGDYGRIKRQQLFMSSLLRSTLSGNVLSNPGKLNGIVNTFINHSFVDGVDTKSLIKLAESMQGMDAGRVSFVTIPTSGTSTDGSNNEIPRTDDVNAIFNAIIDDDPLPGEAKKKADKEKSDKKKKDEKKKDDKKTGSSSSTSSSPSSTTAKPQTVSATALDPTQVTVRVLNGTGQAGVASAAADLLAPLGFVIPGIADASEQRDDTVVRYGTGEEDAAATVAAMIPGASIQPDRNVKSGVEVILGHDYSESIGEQPAAGSTLSVKKLPAARGSNLPNDLTVTNAGDTTCS